MPDLVPIAEMLLIEIDRRAALALLQHWRTLPLEDRCWLLRLVLTREERHMLALALEEGDTP